MAGRGNIDLADAIKLLVRGDVSGSLLKADIATERDPLYHPHVSPTRAWVGTLEVLTSLPAPEVTALQTDLEAAEVEIVGLKARATTLEADTSLQGQQLGTLTTD